jgi:hypothetical protein
MQQQGQHSSDAQNRQFLRRPKETIFFLIFSFKTAVQVHFKTNQTESNRLFDFIPFQHRYLYIQKLYVSVGGFPRFVKLMTLSNFSFFTALHPQ